MVKLKIIIATILTFFGCSGCVVLLEHLIKFSPGCGDLVTFAQFLFISCYGFATTADFGRKKSVVPIRNYLLAVVLFYCGTLAGNLSLGCHISMPIQMIFKSGSVLSSLVLGVLLLKRSYPISKYISVVMISIGIAMCLLISSDPENKESEATPQTQKDYLIWLFGIFLLVSSLFLGASLGVVQERISLEFGKHPEELLFYSHALALPGFLIFSSGIAQQAEKFTASENYTIPYTSVNLPIVWVYLICNVFFQFLCVRSVYVLITEMSALSVTVILTLRKFVSLLISIIYFKNSFTIYHWCGTGLVFTGTLLFSGTLQQLYVLVFPTNVNIGSGFTATDNAANNKKEE